MRWLPRSLSSRLVIVFVGGLILAQAAKTARPRAESAGVGLPIDVATQAGSRQRDLGGYPRTFARTGPPVAVRL
jgi:hypothetical protein